MMEKPEIRKVLKMDFLDLISKAWPVFLGFIGLCGWVFRLESEVKTLTEKTKDLHSRQVHIESELVEKLTRMREQLARIEGALGVGK